MAQEAGMQPLSEFIIENPETAGWRSFGDVPAEPPPTGHRPANTGYRATAMSPG
jgi:hypothetical protein